MFLSDDKHTKWGSIIIGSGVAGLRAAVEAAQAGEVAVISKDALHDSSSEKAQGGIAVALSDEDRIGLHLEDTLLAGAGLCDEATVRTLVREGPAYILELIDWGAEFDRDGGRLAFTREAAHRARRVLHAQGDSTGKEIVRSLKAKAESIPEISFLDYLFTVDLIVKEGRCIGVWTLDTRSGKLYALVGRAVMLATGGCGRLYRITSNPPFATGDGLAVAARAGAALQDMEFMQFHPTTLNIPGAPNFLLTEAIRGEGGVLRNAAGERFMERYHEAAELAPRDVVARSIMTEIRRQGDELITLDLGGLKPEFVGERFPMIFATLSEYGLNLTTDKIPVLPAAHYCMGGVAVDRWGHTHLQGLYAAGEVACNGVHGANRLASNSLLEGLVFGGRCGEAMVEETNPVPQGIKPELKVQNVPFDQDKIERTKKELTEIMWRRVGIERCGDTLAEAVGWLREIRRDTEPCSLNRPWLELRNMALTAEAIAEFACRRTESRGAHFRTDYPSTDDANWKIHQALTRDEWQK
jgi:L-aspartate oxidase